MWAMQKRRSIIIQIGGSLDILKGERKMIKLEHVVLANIYKSRKDHKLDEWRSFCKWIEELPYSELITGKTEED